MDDFGDSKRRKNPRRDRRVCHKEKPKSGNSSGKTANVLSRWHKTEKSYEKRMSRNKITEGRITTRPGLFNQGKCTSFVQRALYLSPNKKARMDEDLHRIIQLANGGPSRNQTNCNMLQRPKDVNSNYGLSINQPLNQKVIDMYNNTENAPESFCHSNSQENTSSSTCYYSVGDHNVKDLNCPDHEMLIKKERNKKSTNLNKPLYRLSSSSSSSNDLSQTELESIQYSTPTLEEYEEFIASAILPMHSKKIELFPERDYLKETREKIRARFHQNQNTEESRCLNSCDIFEENQDQSCQADPSLDALSQSTRLSFEDNHPTVMHDQNSPLRDELFSSELSPFSCVLSPKTTILNPIKYLRRIEQANRRNEKLLHDSGLESGISRESSLSNSQSKAHLSSEIQKNWNQLHLSLETDGNTLFSQNQADNFVYRHSNRSYIDSPQAFKLQESNIRYFHEQPGNPCKERIFPQNDLEVILKTGIVGPRKHPNSEIEQDTSGFQYLMDISEVARPNVSYGDCSDLLDELDAIDCNLNSNSSLMSTSVEKRPTELKKKWGPPPTPPTPEHKFYRRKMF